MISQFLARIYSSFDNSLRQFHFKLTFPLQPQNQAELPEPQSAGKHERSGNAAAKELNWGSTHELASLSFYGEGRNDWQLNLNGVLSKALGKNRSDSHVNTETDNEGGRGLARHRQTSHLMAVMALNAIFLFKIDSMRIENSALLIHAQELLRLPSEQSISQ